MNASLPASLLFAGPESRLAALDELSRKHWLGGLTNSQGSLEPRLATLAELRRSLLIGVLPAPTSWPWPEATIAAALHEAMLALNLPRYCAGRQELADTVLMSVLFHLDFIVDYRDRGASETEALRMAIDAFADDWRERCGQIDELVDVFGLLPEDGKNTNWDQLRGLLRSSGWQEVLRIRRLLERLPELAKLIAGLGRSRETDEDDAAALTVVQLIEETTAPQPASRDVRVPDMPGETRGVRRSDRIARMLPAEAMLLGHPRLRLVWHARRAERTLLSYEDDDRLRETRLQPARVTVPRPGLLPTKKRKMGPILVCVDTSGSMQGGAEAVAKATCLEAMRAAHAQRRACHVFAFGGPDELIDMELSLDANGIAGLTHFLGQAFRGGTDICGPLEKVVAKIEEERWQLADLLVASDGEFGATPDIVARLDAAKREAGLRMQGVLIGDRETVGFLEIADAILPVRDWRRFGAEGGAASPIHSHRLTAMYFPGALRSQENRDATVSPEAAAAAVREGRKL
ncbi:VWA domain-containing protein [Sulfurisoma sediminicola]|uniref:VWA domain containing CoxE-like protein n=1 Tax=Sulfurisoma sediminicola TaxID=1381557 RepID=A0A497XEQ5_9PROT|nr:VWA domain-containing protein [Sulfurisoma sediminicola]RLJ65189.1 VWA domain containing CoxE-like protein [Sulfurisoma sediminicola]